MNQIYGERILAQRKNKTNEKGQPILKIESSLRLDLLAVGI